MHLIKNTCTFAADLPSAVELSTHLDALRYQPVLTTQYSSYGFIEHSVVKTLVAPFEGGYAVTVRMDDKILPAGPVRKAKQDAREAAEKAKGEPLTKDEAEEINVRTMMHLIEHAMVKTTDVTAYYWEADKLLVVATSAKKSADIMINMLIRACESVKTTTIHVDGVKAGLTARLNNHLQDLPKDFGEFLIGDSVTLKAGKDKIAVSMENLDHASSGLQEAIVGGMTVDRIELEHGQLVFTLSSDFRISKIHFFGEPDEALGLAEDAVEEWRLTAGIEMLQVAAVLRDLCTLFGRQSDIEFDGGEPDAEAA